MSKTLKVLLAASMLAVVTGCATTKTPPIVDPVYVVDAERIAIIEHLAKKRGLTVIWVNAPMKEASAEK